MSAKFESPSAAAKPRILVLDDEPLIASLLADWLIELECEPIGPVGTVMEALGLIEKNALDGAIIDVNLHGEQSYAAADALLGRGTPFAFATGREPDSLEERFASAAVLLKPFDFNAVSNLVASWSKTSG